MSPNPRLRLVESLSLQFEAEHLQQVLETAGIESFIEGLHGSSTFAFNATMGSIQVKVREEDFKRAQEALRESRNSQGGPWYCGPCAEFNEPSFDYCWKCNGERSEVESQPPQPAQPDPVEIGPEDLKTQHHFDKHYDPAPYAPPMSALERPQQPPDLSSLEKDIEELEDTVQRGYRASIFGLVTVPVGFHLYSLVLLLSALSIPATWSDKTIRQFRIGLAIDLVVLAVGITIAGYVYAQL